MSQINNELDELQTLSNYAESTSSYIYFNITALSKILHKFDKKFSKYKVTFTEDFILEQFEKKNSDLLYIYQYKILDEVGACVEQLAKELEENYNNLLNNPLLQINNANLEILNQSIDQGNLLQNVQTENQQLQNDETAKLSSPEEIKNIKNKLKDLYTSIDEMEAFYHFTSKIFRKWRKYIKSNELKSHIYSVKRISKIGDENSNIEKDEKKPKHFMSNESYWNIRIILTQAFIMSMCSTYIFPTIFYMFYNKLHDNRFCFLSGLVLSMIPIGGLFSMFLVKIFEKKSYKIPMIISSILSILGNLLFTLSINNINLDINNKSVKYTLFYLLFIGRFIVGFSLNTPIHRQYLLYFIPERKMSKYLLYFKLIILLGKSVGPLLLLIFLIQNKDSFLRCYTVPGWIFSIISIILLLLVFILFTEPLNKNFNVYAEGHAPTETLLLYDSFTLNDSLTNYEAEKLDEINKKVSNFNDENQYHDANLVSSIINELIEIENKSCGTIRIAFWIVIFYELFLNYTLMSYITMAPIYLYLYIPNPDLKNKDSLIIYILVFFSMFFIVPTYFIHLFLINDKIDKILYIKVLTLLLLLLELVTSLIIPHHLPIIYYLSFSFSILFAYILEDQLVYFFIKIIPTDFKLLGIQGVTSLHIIAYIGDIFGTASCLFGLIDDKLYKLDKLDCFVDHLMIRQNCFGILFEIIIAALFFKNTKRFSDKPIRRIIYSKNKRKIRRTEF